MNRTVLLVGLLIACSKREDGGKHEEGGSHAERSPIDAAAINAAIPAELKGKLEFAPRKLVDGKTTYAVVAPNGWKPGFMPASLEPADADGFGSKAWGRTTMKIGSNCDGDCVAKDWAKVSDKVHFQQYASGQVTGKVLKDDKQPGERTLVFQNEPTVQTNSGSATVTVNGQTTTSSVTSTSGSKGITIIRAWWTEGARRYYTCSVELGEPAMGFQAAFEKACANVVVE